MPTNDQPPATPLAHPGALKSLHQPAVQNKLKELSTQEADARTMMIEGILSIQAGDNPRIVEEKLKTFLEPGERKHFEEEGGARDAGGLDAKAA